MVEIPKSPLFLILTIVLIPFLTGLAEAGPWKENFDNMEDWKPLTFPKIKEHSEYTLIPDNSGGSVLRAESRASASGVIHKREFDVTQFPIVTWRWKVDNVYENADGETKDGDDYPIRIYVVFKYDPKRASVWERAKYASAKLIYGEYPPESSLNYVWASKEGGKQRFPNPFTDKAHMIVLRSGKSQVGTWQEERVNVLEDYRKAFGKEPPKEASIAIMNDSDNTGEASVSYVDFIGIKELDQ